MKKIVFIADFFKKDLNGGGESNDNNLIDHLSSIHTVSCTRTQTVSISLLEKADTIIIGNFIGLPEGIKRYLISHKKYIIYEHDHKYITTRDPSKFPEFKIPRDKLINEKFYLSSYCTVVLSAICKKIMQQNLRKVNVHNIGCSLWSKPTFDFLSENSNNKKTKNLCIMKSSNPTKNYINTVKFCKTKNLEYEEIGEKSHHGFLKEMSNYKKLLFIPTVLETFSRLCAEAKMLNLDIMTNKTMIGFFSEDCSSLHGIELIEKLKEKNKKALKFFEEII